MHQPLDQVTMVERDDHLLTVDGQNSVTTDDRLLSKGRRGNKENVIPTTSRATTAASRTADINKSD